MKLIEIKGGLRIEHRPYKIKDTVDLWYKINELFNEGYRFKKPDTIRQTPTFYPIMMVELEKIGEDVVAPLKDKIKELEFKVKNLTDYIEDSKEVSEEVSEEVREDTTEVKDEKLIIADESTPIEIEASPLDELKKITTKEPLLKFASKNNIVVPEDIKVVPAIKKFLKESIETK